MIVLSGGVRVINQLRFSDDASALAASGWSGFQVWRELAPNTRPRTFAGTDGVREFAFLPQTRKLYGIGTGLFHIDPDARTCVAVDGERPIQQFALSPDGNRLLLVDLLSRAYTLSCREVAPTHPLVWEQPGVFWGYEMQFLPSGKSVLGLIRDYGFPRTQARFTIHDVDSGNEIHRSERLAESPDKTIVSPDERLVAGMMRRRIRIYPLHGRFSEPLATIQNDTSLHFTGIAFHPSGRYLAATSNDTTVKLYDTTNWEVARTFTWNIGKMRSIAFSRDGTLAAAGGDHKQVVVWDVDL